MVFFTCELCGEALKKNQVLKHCFRCRSSSFSCIDCQKVFDSYSFQDHIKCISEDQKYGGANYVEKAKKGEQRQNSWVEQVSQAIEHVHDARLKRILLQVQGQANIPRKEAKFINFLRNSLRVRDQKLCAQAWAAIIDSAKRIQAELEAAKNGEEKNGQSSTNETNNNGTTAADTTTSTTTTTSPLSSADNNNANDTTTTTEDLEKSNNGNNDTTTAESDSPAPRDAIAVDKPFKWRAAIKRRLKSDADASDDGSGAVRLKRLRRDVIAESLAHAAQFGAAAIGGDDGDGNDVDEARLKEVFAQKLAAVGGVRVDGKMVYLERSVEQ